jgi:hypothetical protein
VKVYTAIGAKPVVENVKMVDNAEATCKAGPTGSAGIGPGARASFEILLGGEMAHLYVGNFPHFP